MSNSIVLYYGASKFSGIYSNSETGHGGGGGFHSDFAQSCGKSNISILGSQISMSLIVTLQTPPQHIKKRLCILLNSLLLKIECVGNFFIVLQFTGGGGAKAERIFPKQFYPIVLLRS